MPEVYVVAARSYAPADQAGAPEAAAVVTAALAAAGLKVAVVDALIVSAAGAPLPEGLAAQVGWLAGAPVGLSARGLTGCGMEAIFAATQAIASGYAEIIVAVGIQLKPADDTSPLLPLTPPLDWRLAPAGVAEAEAREAQRVGVDDAQRAALHERLSARGDGGPAPARATPVAGASAIVLMSRAALTQAGLTPRARVVSLGERGADPALWPSAAPAAARQALLRLGFEAGDIGAWGLDERSVEGLAAAAAALELPPHRVNVALDTLRAGHMGAAEAPRRLDGLLDEMNVIDARFGALALSWPTSQGRALVLDREFYL